MKKTIFKGIINGKEFDSVQEYNKEMMKAIENGYSIQAESHTETVDEYDNFTPYFSKDDGDYLDKLVDGTQKDEDRYVEMVKTLDDATKELRKFISNASYNELMELAKKYDDILKIIDRDTKDNLRCLEKLDKQLQQLRSNKNLCTNAKPVLEHLSDFYDDLYEQIDMRLKDITDHDHVCKCGGNGKCGEVECTCKEKEPQRTYSIDRLINAIFN